MCAIDMGNGLERVMGIEPTLSAWEAEVLPLNYTRTRMDSRYLRENPLPALQARPYGRPGPY